MQSLFFSSAKSRASYKAASLPPDSACIALKVRRLTSRGITTDVHKDKEYGISPVDWRGIVLNPQST